MTDVKTIYLDDYQPPAFLIDKTALTFELEEQHTCVSSRLELRRNPAADNGEADLYLHGEELELLSLAIDGKPLDERYYQKEAGGLTLLAVPEHFTLECVTRIDPAQNTALEGLYLSNGMYCTQCEAEGFRKITYYLDRPDVMSEFETTIIAEAGRFSAMLSNGNCLSDETKDGKRIVRWHDPFKKPGYLFALVAGNLACLEDHFVTLSGREVLLQIYAEQKDLQKCDFAMQSLKNAMRWDEETYGREYDLDRFMVVAVDHFNMGAMENKGLNIFNTSCVLAHPKTTTDTGFQRVEAVVAHEYFHNWSGNRVTCRDWFQLSLKEGFTVLRDAQFSADMNSAAVKRIEDATLMRTVQFAEDAGPMAHPVRPDSYIEIGNFYTITVYEKGAEVVRMQSQLLGPETFRAACDLYFKRFDGQAVTCEDFVRCMEEASGRDLTQFRLWYQQAGTPELHISDRYDAQSRQYQLTVKQIVPPTAGQPHKEPMHIPLKMALYGEHNALPMVCDGGQLGLETVLDITKAEQTFVFDQVAEPPVPSLLRDFSAPVKVFYPYTPQDLQRLILQDSDGFSRWDAMQNLQLMVLQGMIDGAEDKKAQNLLTETLQQLLQTADNDDPALLALMLTLPAPRYMAEFYQEADPAAIDHAWRSLQQQLAAALQTQLLSLYQALEQSACGMGGPAMAARSLRNKALHYLMQLDKDDYRALCLEQFQTADNMTDQLAALATLVQSEHGGEHAGQALAQFYRQWSDETLVVNMWLQVQAVRPQADALQRVETLLSHPAFDYGNPNRIRALVGGFCQNFARFHAADGSGYRFLADQVVFLDRRNPQIAARLLGPLTQWRAYEPGRSRLMQETLQALLQQTQSRDVYEVVSKSLADS